MHSIKLAYLEEIKKLWVTSEDTGLDKFPLKKQGRPVLLGGKIDTMVQEYLKNEYLKNRVDTSLTDPQIKSIDYSQWKFL